MNNSLFFYGLILTFDCFVNLTIDNGAVCFCSLE